MGRKREYTTKMAFDIHTQLPPATAAYKGSICWEHKVVANFRKHNSQPTKLKYCQKQKRILECILPKVEKKPLGEWRTWINNSLNGDPNKNVDFLS